MNSFKTDAQCRRMSKNNWICNLPEGYGGDTHVAIGGKNRVIEVWTTEIVTETKERTDFLQEIE